MEDIHSYMFTKKKIEVDNEKRMIQDKHFMELSEYTNKVIFEWNLHTNKIEALSNFHVLFNQAEAPAQTLEAVLSNSYIHKEDYPTFENVFETIRFGNGVSDARFRIKDAQGAYHWCSLSCIVIEDYLEKPFRALGMIESIAEQLNKEEDLRQKAEHDQLTGLYNKTTAEYLIEECLKTVDKSKKHVLMIIDVDNFKNVNDSLGHLFGDIVLKQLATFLKSIFRESDIVGRLGGDEFFAFIKDCASEELLIKKATEICRLFNRTYSEGKKHASISASVGISICPEQGTDFEQLYKNADIALYNVKSDHKNNFKIYNGESTGSYVSDRTDIDRTSKTKNSFRENRVEYIFRLLYESDDVVANIQSALQFITEQFDFSRGYVFETDPTGQYTDNTFEWCVEDITPEIHNLQNVPIHIVNTANTSFIQNGVFIIENVKNMPKEESEILQKQGIISMFQFGIMKKGMPIGFVGLDDCTKPHTPSEEELEELKLICNVFATFLTKQRASELAQANYTAMLSILNNFEGYTYVVDRNSYKVVFENANTRTIIGRSSVGKHCYEQYMNNSKPCMQCPIAKLSKENTTSTVEIHNASLGVFTRTTASIVEWINGKQNYLISSVDITDYKQPKENK